MIQNSWTNLLAFQGILNSGQMLETRMDYDGSGNLIYVGFSKTPNANTSEKIWFILKLYYIGANNTRVQIPDNGVGFVYDWDNRSTAFS